MRPEVPAVETPARVAGGQFAPGSSGNPAGRPRGARNASTSVLVAMLDGGGPEVIARFVELAKSGAPWAVKLFVDKALPKYERRIDLADFPRVASAEGIRDAVADVIAMAAAGLATLPEARQFLLLIEQQRRAIETGELADRLIALEEDGREKKWR